MKIPARPPQTLVGDLMADPDVFNLAWESVDVARERYLSWEQMRFRPAPDGLTREQWWSVTALKRHSAARTLPLRQVDGRNFWFTLPDVALRDMLDLAQRAGGNIGLREPVTNAETRDQYLVRGLMEEAITSSQLEGAMTTRRVAKEMLRAGRSPVTTDERMIWNNYHGMQYVRDHARDIITVEGILELHAILVEGTLENPSDAGRPQTPEDERIHVGTFDGVILHRPPMAHSLPQRLAELCSFANGGTGDETWLPPVARAIFVHFMVGHDHAFVDGNGRLARTLFYWVMLREGFWLTEYTTISTILKGAQTKYAHAYLNSEYEGDVTFFLVYQLEVLRRAFDALEAYLEGHTTATEAFKKTIHSDVLGLNHRQVAILERALHDSALDLTMESHGSTHGVSHMTARSDLHGLEKLGLLVRHKQGRRHHWWPAPNIGSAAHRLATEATRGL